MKTISMKCQILFSEQNKEIIITLSPAEKAQRVVKVKRYSIYTAVLKRNEKLVKSVTKVQELYKLCSF